MGLPAIGILVLGLLIFLGTHSVRIFADGWRSRQLARLGDMRWKAGYAILSAIGFALILWGYGLARNAPTLLWLPPAWTRHLAALLTLPAFILIAAAYIPGSRIKAAIGHPMLAGAALWAVSHLLTNGMLADLLLFGSFAAWAVTDFVSAHGRDRRAGVRHGVRSPAMDAAVVVAGTLAWAVFARYLHAWLIGVQPFF